MAKMPALNMINLATISASNCLGAKPGLKMRILRITAMFRTL